MWVSSVVVDGGGDEWWIELGFPTKGEFQGRNAYMLGKGSTLLQQTEIFLTVAGPFSKRKVQAIATGLGALFNAPVHYDW